MAVGAGVCVAVGIGARVGVDVDAGKGVKVGFGCPQASNSPNAIIKMTVNRVRIDGTLTQVLRDCTTGIKNACAAQPRGSGYAFTLSACYQQQNQRWGR